jgi:hypothetical protein
VVAVLAAVVTIAPKAVMVPAVIATCPVAMPSPSLLAATPTDKPLPASVATAIRGLRHRCAVAVLCGGGDLRGAEDGGPREERGSDPVTCCKANEIREHDPILAAAVVW